MIHVNQLSKIFHDKKGGARKVVDQVSFDVKPGEIFGLLGPNGAGKTTTLRMLATILAPSEGTATIGGFDIACDPDHVRQNIGFLSGDMGQYPRLTAREILSFFAELNGLSGERRRETVSGLIQRFDMESFADTTTDKLSSGLRQRVAIARTVLHDPGVLILDEPTCNLDVPTACLIESFILNARDSGKCILYSSHVMEEAEYLCDRIAVIHEGKITATGTIDELRAMTGKQRLREIFLSLLGKVSPACLEENGEALNYQHHLS